MKQGGTEQNNKNLDDKNPEGNNKFELPRFFLKQLARKTAKDHGSVPSNAEHKQHAKAHVAPESNFCELVDFGRYQNDMDSKESK